MLLLPLPVGLHIYITWPTNERDDGKLEVSGYLGNVSFNNFITRVRFGGRLLVVGWMVVGLGEILQINPYYVQGVCSYHILSIPACGHPTLQYIRDILCLNNKYYKKLFQQPELAR
jgi:hypothetical protein